jgi:hypothetical protein
MLISICSGFPGILNSLQKQKTHKTMMKHSKLLNLNFLKNIRHGRLNRLLRQSNFITTILTVFSIIIQEMLTGLKTMQNGKKLQTGLKNFYGSKTDPYGQKKPIFHG